MLSVNGEAVTVNDGYIEISRQWNNNDIISLELDIRCEPIYPIPYGSQILMNKVIWGANTQIPQFDKEDPIAKNHIALRLGPVMLAQDSRLGYSVDDAIDVVVNDDGYVDVVVSDEKRAGFDTVLEADIPLSDGNCMRVVDYSSAGKLWNEESKMAVWMLTK